ncbi:glyoxylate/hydroxypyruvate reductase HPR3-like [Gastrolobium bilobum]|uniref:glyoxylate/hydroxypyruvate reductase HPR3-like n=1 Tax=Gastrolobium bilobum TaxID=150636 RepID=UPI002AB2719D|nr:glyoxylate/hydroxypyruvate reductase HPR3-like [Gastrolobium bilobum]
MAEEANHSIDSNNVQELPKVVVLGLPTCFSTLEQKYCNKFHFLNSKASGFLPLQQFLIDHNHQSSSIQAILCSISASVNADVLRLFPSLGLVVTTSAGTDHIDLKECRRRRIQVAGAGELFSADVAEMAVALLIDVMRKISEADRYMKTLNHSGPWDFPLGSKLSGKRVGIVGLGSIGMEVAKRLECFGCIILYHSRHKKTDVSYPFYSSVVELANSSSALVVCCALNEQTKHIINREVMSALGKGGFIVNVGRGGLIDEKQLVKCLMEGEIGGAGLDVFENEPHVPQELFAMNNVVLSPHSAAFTEESLMSLCELLGGNLEAFFSNKPLITPVMLDG